MTGPVAPPYFNNLYEQITYKQWIRPSFPMAYLPEPPRAQKVHHGSQEDSGQADKKKRMKKIQGLTPTEERNYIWNPNFDMELKQPGIEIGKISTFL
jgi:hypothetical protein